MSSRTRSAAARSEACDRACRRRDSRAMACWSSASLRRSRSAAESARARRWTAASSVAWTACARAAGPSSAAPGPRSRPRRRAETRMPALPVEMPVPHEGAWDGRFVTGKGKVCASAAGRGQRRRVVVRRRGE
ncbi:hypothetical protein DY240_04985 [Jiangella rhizosphaerae]|uniref:Uncharacterized protein n=1 Tax=Jiangella rhizosphaerae TaxID=2293569 RepID=A0A418KV24_9ACTN|nr:hypothetical protein DY240_04985 [Jiangella rhizosphaerae]